MKRTFTIPVAALLLMVAGLTNCKKEQPTGQPETTRADGLAASSFTAEGEDRIDVITRDLAQSNYSLSFDKPITSASINRTAYGADSYLAFADPQDLICGDPIRRIQKLYPIIKFPQFIPPTCPEMIIGPNVLEQITQLLLKADPRQFKGLQGIRLSNGGALLATPAFKQQFTSLQVDRVDAITKDLDASKFLLISDPLNADKMFTRKAYGYADLNKYVLGPYKINLKDLIKPKSIGCFDPAVLKVIEARFQAVNPAIYKGLGVNAIDQAGNVGTLALR